MLILLKAEKLMPGGRLALPLVSSYDQYGTAMPKHDPEPADIDFDCVNKPIYNCPEQVSRAGAKCSECVVSKAEHSIFGIQHKYLVGECKKC